MARADGRLLYFGLVYCHELSALQSMADLVVSRAGAGSIAEILALGKASVLVPDRNVPGDHQQANARVVLAQGGAETVAERPDPVTGRLSVPAADLADKVLELLADGDRRVELGAAARALHAEDFGDRFSTTVDELLTHRMPAGRRRRNARSGRRTLRLALAMLRRGDRSGGDA